MKAKILYYLLFPLFVCSIVAAAGRLQNEDFKTLTELTNAGGSMSQLLNDTKVYLSAGGLNRQLSTALTDGSIQTGSATGQTNELSNMGLAAVASSNALTVSLKQADGSTNPSTGAGQVFVSFHIGDPTIGSYRRFSVTTSTSVTISNGATLGLPASTDAYIYVYAIDASEVGGTFELAVSAVHWDEGVRVSTAAMSSSSDSNNAIYSTTARSNVHIRLLGRLTAQHNGSDQWTASPSYIAITYPDKAAIAAIYNTSNTTVDAAETIMFSNKIKDPLKIVNTSTGVVTVPKTGYYMVTARLFWAGQSWTSGKRINVNVVYGATTDLLGHYIIVLTGTYDVSVGGSKLIYLSAGDTFVIQGQENEGVDKGLDNSTDNYMTVMYMGDSLGG